MISLALAGNGPYGQQQQSPFRVRPNQNQNQVVPIPVRSNGGYSGYNKYQGPYSPYQQNPFYRKPVYQQQPQPVYGHYHGGPQYEQYVQSQYGPFRVGGYSPRPQYAQEEYPGTMSGGFRPQINNRIVIHGSGGQTQARPVPVPVPGYNYNRPQHFGYRRPVSKPGQVVKVPNPQKVNKVKVNKHSNKRRPTPVIKQSDDEVYPYEPVVSEDSVDSSADVADSYEHEQEVHLEQQRGTTVTKSRRIPKMAKKSKVNKKKVNADPLNILKKSNSKSRRN